MKIIRQILAPVILFLDTVTRPKPMKRSEQLQAVADVQAQHFALYQFHACPFCVKVRRVLHQLNVKIDLRDAKTEQYEQELLKEGGKRKVPCLRIEENGSVRWMYDSKVITEYLKKTFS